MRLYNPYTRGYIEYPLNFSLEKLTYHIEHETFFCPYFTAWAVTALHTFMCHMVKIVVAIFTL